MDIQTIMQAQTRLRTLGYYLGKIDGVIGRGTTDALRRFQADKKIPVQWPGTLGPKTLAALGIVTAAPVVNVEPPWYLEGVRKMGLHEVRNRQTLMQWLRSDKKTLGDPSRLPWCGDFVETCLALTLPQEVLPANPYLARNWATWGGRSDLTLGAVVVFWRGSRQGTSGHVGFCAGRGNGTIYVLGGNQANSISIVPLSDDRLLAVRWPSTLAQKPVHLPRRTGGAVSQDEA